MNRTIKTIFAILALMSVGLPTYAVTDKEMEQAKVITAQAYLRYANNGSGYLDELSPKTMSELTSKLKQKEQENLKAFNSVEIPKDYATWDKTKLIEFWGTTFFSSPKLMAEGKAARTRVRARIGDMNVSAPASKEDSKPAEAKNEEVKPEESKQPADQSVAPAETPTAEVAIEQQEEILADQQAIAEDAEQAETTSHEETNNTWVYIVVLAILVGIVIWLVVYAANLMRRRPEDEEENRRESRSSDKYEITNDRTQADAEEISNLRRRLQQEENRSAELSAQVERLKLEIERSNATIASLREENTHISAARTRKAEPEAVEPKSLLKVIYLGRANVRGIFVRADRRINPGNTIYRLDTNDGLVGTFHVVDEPEVIETALSNPEEFLMNGATGDELNDTAGVTRIVTESAGTAIFENGYWKVLRKTKIRYE